MAKKAAKKATTKKTVKKATPKTVKKPAEKAVPKPTKKAPQQGIKKPAKKAAPRPTRKAIQTAAQGQVKAAPTWVVWQDARGVWVGTKHEFERSKMQETVVSDVFDVGDNRELDALRRAVQMGMVMRQSYATCVQQYGRRNLKGGWLEYDGAAQGERIKQWEDRVRELISGQ
jgi:hypothetical protein